jgi:DNA-binding CsgD family transcriptional regulator
MLVDSEHNPSANNTIELIRVLNNSILALGVKKVISYLKWITKMNGNDSKDVADLVVYSVCSKYKIAFSTLLENERNDGDYNDAMCLIAVLLKKHALMSQNQIAKKLNRHKSQISKYVTRMSQLNVELFKLDRQIQSTYLEISESIEKVIQNNNLWKKEEEDQERISNQQ